MQVIICIVLKRGPCEYIRDSTDLIYCLPGRDYLLQRGIMELYLTLVLLAIGWESSAGTGCDSFKYGTLCSTAHPGNTIWTIPDLENEIECQVRYQRLEQSIIRLARLNVFRQQAATTLCLWSSPRETQNVSSSIPVTSTPPTRALRNQTV